MLASTAQNPKIGTRNRSFFSDLTMFFSNLFMGVILIQLCERALFIKKELFYKYVHLFYSAI